MNFMDELANIDIKNKLRTTKVIQEYLQLLNHLEDVLVIVAVKDTPGYFWDDSFSRGLSSLGLKENLQNKHWCGYVAATCNGHALIEKLGSQNESISGNLVLTNGENIDIVSKPFHAGNMAEIIIGKTNYAVNKRGLNIVVLDVKSMYVIDSVCFDTHSPHAECSRLSWLSGSEVLNAIEMQSESNSTAHINIENLLFHNNHKSLELRARAKVQNGKALKVFFIVPYASKFGLKSIYKSMEKNEMFDPYIFVVHSRDLLFSEHPEYKEDVKRDYKWFVEQGYKTIFGYDENFCALGLDAFSPDIVFQTFPNLYFTSFYNNLYINFNFLSCYISYGMHIVEDYDYHFENRYINTSWKVFTDTRFTYTRAIRETKHGGLNWVLSGYPKLDDYAKVNKTKDNRKKVIIAPHWSIRTIHSMAVFHLYYKNLIELLDRFEEIDFYLKPHPDLPYRIEALQGNATGFDMTIDDYNNYVEDWKNHSNGFVVSDGDYIDLFAKSDALLTDCGSFVGEYLASGKPCIYMLNPEKSGAQDLPKWFSNLGVSILQTYYLCNSWGEIEDKFIEVVVQGNDTLKTKREKIKNEAFVNLGTAGEFIVRYLENCFL